MAIQSYLFCGRDWMLNLKFYEDTKFPVFMNILD